MKGDVTQPAFKVAHLASGGLFFPNTLSIEGMLYESTLIIDVL